jgi:hypothetical protein
LGIYTTSSRIEYEYMGESYTVHGEALNPDVGGLDYVVYATDMHFTTDARKHEPIPTGTQIAVLDGIKAELSKRGTKFEVDDEDTVYAAAAVDVGVSRAEAGQPCPRDGYWFTPARTQSRRHFTAGEIMPGVGGDYGITIWQWDKQQ